METPLRVLLVAASHSRAASVVDELRQAGYDVAWEVVRDRAEMETAVSRSRWDVIIARTGLPGFESASTAETGSPALIGEAVFVLSDAIGSEDGTSIAPPLLTRLVMEVERKVSAFRLQRERQLAWRVLRASESRFRALAESTPDAILTIDSEGTVLFANRPTEQIFGVAIPATIGRPIERLLPGLLPINARGGNQARGSFPAGRPSIEFVGVHPSGRQIPLELSISSFRRQGKTLHTVVARDVTDRKHTEGALKASEARKSAIIEAALDAIITIDGEGRVLEFNSAAEKMFGYSRSDSLGRPMADLIVPASVRDQHRRGLARYLASGEAAILGKTIEMTAMRSDGFEFPIELTVTRLPSEGPPIFTGFIHDVTEQRRVESALKKSEQKLRTLVGNVPVVLFAIDRDGTFTHSEGKGLESLGLGPREVVGRSVRDVFADHRDVLDHVRRALAGDAHTATVRIGEVAFETRYAPYRDDEGSVGGVIGVAIDVSERWRAEQALRASESRYRTLYERNLAGVFRVTMDGWLLDCNESFARIFGYPSPADALRQPALDFYLRPADRNTFLARLRETGSLSNFELAARRRDGSPIWVLENATLVEGPDGIGPLIEGTVIDITERKRAEDQVKHLAFHDALTGLPNRLLFNDRLTMALAQAHRSRQKLATIYLDLDRFKVINDSLGHAVGDELLRRVADRLRLCIREEDTIARLGGDEFILLVPRLSSEEDVETVGRKILNAIRLPFKIDDREFFLTSSIGISVYPADGIDSETLVQNADSAMYRAKERGRDNYQLYSPAMNPGAIDRLSLENRLRQALSNGELVLFYQPVVDLRDGRIRGAEALLRWRHPERGLLNPGEFITLAEISGLITPIGRWVLKSACAQIRAWKAMGHHRLTVSINLSPRQFQQVDLVGEVATALSASEIEAGSLDLEITESSAMENPQLAINTLWELRKLGVGISMDDFGTGYSSLNYLKKFPIDRLKLDQSFVRDVVTKPEDAAIVRAVINMAHTLQLVVVAEGVENEDQLAFLRQQRCDEMQGYLFSPAIEAAEFEKLLRRRQALVAIA
jgi:diguanylate cyclase (GGDEF)-like protein/PAS domain S-box-containing protein